MSGLKIPEKSRPHWLVVEGDDDKFVAIELLARHGAFWGDHEREADLELPHIPTPKGVDALLRSTPVELKNKRRFGIIIDADKPEDARWSQLRKALKSVQTPPDWLGAILAQLPEVMPNGGLVVENEGRALGIWVMPDNGPSGTLEEFLHHLLPVEDRHWRHARQSVSDAMDRGVEFAQQHRPKAEIHTWLAWQREPGVPFGRAIKSSYFRHDSSLAMDFVTWFRRVFPRDNPT